jgi:hypothetical protein
VTGPWGTGEASDIQLATISPVIGVDSQVIVSQATTTLPQLQFAGATESLYLAYLPPIVNRDMGPSNGNRIDRYDPATGTLFSVCAQGCDSFGIDPTGSTLVATNASHRLVAIPTNTSTVDALNQNANSSWPVLKASQFSREYVFVPGTSLVELVSFPSLQVFNIDELDYASGMLSSRATSQMATQNDLAVSPAWIGYSTQVDALTSYGNLVLQTIGSTTPIPFGSAGFISAPTTSGVFAFTETPSRSKADWFVEIGSPTGTKTATLAKGTFGGQFIDDQHLLVRLGPDLVEYDLQAQSYTTLVHNVNWHWYAASAHRLFYGVEGASAAPSDGIYVGSL